MALSARIGLLFLALSVIFLAATWRDSIRTKGRSSPRRRTWSRVAVIFAIIGLGLQLLPTLLGR